MAYTTINKSSAHFDTNLYTSSGSGQTISGMDFKPSMVWTKNRDNSSYIHAIVDQVRGGTKKRFPNSTTAETTDANAITAWTSDGYTFGSSGSFNYSTEKYVNWCWKGNDAGVSNTTGDINSTVSVNTAGGFSIVKYTGNGTYQATVGHGLGVVPKMIIVMSLTFSREPTVYHVGMGNNKNMHLNDTSTPATEPSWGNTTPTSSVFTISGASQSNWYDTNKPSEDYIAYCFADIVGYQKCGSYLGNGSADGTFVYTGFKPTLVVYKNMSEADEWFVKDSKRPAHNPTDLMFWSADNAETSLDRLNIYSNGFKLTTTDKGANKSGNSYVYLAIGQTMVGSNNTPATGF